MAAVKPLINPSTALHIFKTCNKTYKTTLTLRIHETKQHPNNITEEITVAPTIYVIEHEDGENAMTDNVVNPDNVVEADSLDNSQDEDPQAISLTCAQIQNESIINISVHNSTDISDIVPLSNSHFNNVSDILDDSVFHSR